MESNKKVLARLKTSSSNLYSFQLGANNIIKVLVLNCGIQLEKR